MFRNLVFAAAVLSFASAFAAQPVLFYSDLESGPNSGGQNNKGAFVSIYGRNFGATRGTSTVTIGGGAADNYPVWSDTKITFQLGASAATGNVLVSVAGAGTSNSLPFTVRAGNVFFVATGGNDNNSGSFAAPWQTIVKAKNAMAPGDITYIENGVTCTTEENYSAAINIENDGLPGKPMALVAYPGATVTIGVAAGNPDFAIRIPNIGVSGNYWVLVGLTLRADWEAISMGGNGAQGWRVVACDMSCPNAVGGQNSKAFGCFTAGSVNGIKVFGNTVHDNAVNTASTVSKLYHGIYFGDTNHVEIAWNIIRDNQCNRSIQFHSTPLGPGTGLCQFDLNVHDNLIFNGRGDGINFATVDPSQGAVKAYNNIIYTMGTGPDFPEGSSDYSGIYVAGMTEAGTDGSGNVEIYNNTFYDCGGRLNSDSATFACNAGAGNSPNLFMLLKNNIVYSINGENYIAADSAGSNIIGSNNLFFGNGTGPSFLTNNVNADPKFSNLATRDFHLLGSSPAVDAGTNTGVATDISGTARPQGNADDIGAYEYTSSVLAIGSSSPLPNGTVGSMYSFTFSASGGVSPYTWSMAAGSLPAGLTLTASGTISGTPSTSGTANFTAKVTDSTNATATKAFALTINSGSAPPPPPPPPPPPKPPVVNSPPSVNPSTVTVGTPVTFTASATDPTGGTVTYSWNFGDGTSGSGSSAGHTYSAAGPVTVTLTLTTPSGGTLTLIMNINVLNVGGGGGSSAIPMTISKAQGAVKAGGGHDGCTFSGTLPGVSAGFDPTGQGLTLNFGGAIDTFTLDKNGRGKNANGSILLKLSPSKRDKSTHKKLFLGGNVSFSGKLQNGTWADNWGMSLSTAVSNVPITMSITIALAGNNYTATITVKYSAKASSGKFKK